MPSAPRPSGPPRPALLFAIGTLLSLAGPARAANLTGRVIATTGTPIAGAVVRTTSGSALVETGLNGSFRLAGLPDGPVQVAVSAPNCVEWTRSLDPSTGPVEVVLLSSSVRSEVTVVAKRLVSSVEQAERVSGSYDSLGGTDLERSRVFTANEALRKIPGVHARDEEGFALRPNIGIRGLNPTRSSKVLLLEDGLPLAYAPYGDNASYYHPPIDRFRSVEVLKGASQIAYGPQTLGGVVNYLTAEPPADPSASIALTGGSRDYLNAHATAGGRIGAVGVLADYVRKQGDGARENTSTVLDDVSLKAVAPIGESQTLTLKGAFYQEGSTLTYSGLTQAEWEENPRQNPFVNDRTDFRNLSASLVHDLVLSPRARVSTALYGSRFSRDWWRQSSNSTQRPNDRNDPACGGMANLSTSCGNEGRLRDYTTWGVTPRLSLDHGLLRSESQLHAGVRWHQERQERIQKNGPLPDSRDGVVVEDNRRDARALSAFVDNRFTWGRLTVTPGVRFESISYDRTNRLGNGGTGVSGADSLTQLLSGLGVSYRLAPSTTVFSGLHRGFAPPRVEDVVSNAGGVVELDPELSWNAELGLRTEPTPGVSLQATLFRMDYENQIVPASLAGGVGATLTNGGETLQQGVEGSLLLEAAPLLATVHDVWLRAVFTWLPTAEFEGARTSSVAGFTNVSVSGNRLPYAPETLLTAAAGYRHPAGLGASIEAVYTGAQYGDDLNTVAPSADGQRGLIPSSLLWNATLDLDVPRWRTSFFVTVKNLFDETVIVDRSRGVLPSISRLVQAGFKVSL